MPDGMRGALAQLGERLICIQEVIGSIPIGSTSFMRLVTGLIGQRMVCTIVRCAASSDRTKSLTLLREKHQYRWLPRVWGG